MTFVAFVAIFLFQSPKPLLLHSLLVGLITATLFFNNIASKDILKLPGVQNCLARVLTRSLLFSHSVPPVKSLHWVPLQSRNIFKLCTIAVHTLYSGEPSYLLSMLSLPPKLRDLRSSGFQLLSVPRDKTHAGTRGFSVAVPTLWN